MTKLTLSESHPLTIFNRVQRDKRETKRVPFLNDQSFSLRVDFYLHPLAHLKGKCKVFEKIVEDLRDIKVVAGSEGMLNQIEQYCKNKY